MGGKAATQLVRFHGFNNEPFQQHFSSRVLTQKKQTLQEQNYISTY